MNRFVPASLHSATPKKNARCFLDLAGVKFFLKKERTFFFGVLPFCFGQVTEQCGRSFGKTLTHLFLNSDVANGKGGVWLNSERRFVTLRI